MFRAIFRNPVALFYAIVVHAMLGGVLFLSFDWSWEEEQPKLKVVQAVAVDESKIKDQIKNLKKAEEKKRKQEEARKRKLEKQAKDAEKRRKKEEQRLADLKKQQEQEVIKQKEQQKKEQKKLADIKKRQDLERRKQVLAEKKRKDAEIKRKKEEQRLAKLEEKRKKEEAKRQKDEEERLLREQLIAEEEALLAEAMAAEQAELQNQMQNEQKLIDDAKEQEALSIVDKYRVLIRQKVERSWRKPSTAKAGMKSTVFVRLVPGGGVLHVETIESSGDPKFDESVEKAVWKAEPLPLPPDPNLFERFRNMNLVFKPEDKS